MTFTDAAAEVLRLVGKPLHYKEITDIAIEKNLLSHVGKSPEVTMGARLAATLKKDTGENPLVRVKPGVFALREWDEKTIKAGLDGKKGAKKGAKLETQKELETERDDDDSVEEADPPTEDFSSPMAADADRAIDSRDDDDEVISGPGQETASSPVVEAARARPAPQRIEDEDREPPGPDEAMRAEAVARGAEMFDEEEDDDQPILGGDDRPAAGGVGADQGDGRRRRRRRRRGRGGEAGAVGAAPSSGNGGGGGGLPSYTAVPAFETRRESGRESHSSRDSQGGGARSQSREVREVREVREIREEGNETPFRGPQVIELTGGDGQALDDLAGRELSDAIAVILSTFDRNAGAVSLRQIAETAQRRGRLAGDAQLVQSQVAAAVRADNHRRLAAGQRPRFRFAGGRVALTDWLLGGDLGRLEQEALAAVERYRDAARRAFARKLSELPGHAFVEVCVLALERIGMGQLRAIRRAGAPGGETHFSGVLSTVGDQVRTALVIRRDGREIGRERVTELRGSLHHYGPATVGWIFTAGQTLSGAREESAIPGTPPITLFDGLGVARLCEDNDVAVVRARMPIAIPDLDLLEALRAS